jgi:hypothetical protein
MDRAAYGHFLDQLTVWASQQRDVIGLVAVGSTASTERLPDEYSDHDLIVVTRPGTSDALRDDPTWLPGHERVVVWHPESEHGRAVIFDDGHLVELAVLDDNDMERVPVNTYRVLVDRADITERVAEMARRTHAESTAQWDDHTRHFHTMIEQMIVGLLRHGRGEHLSANERIRGRAMSELLWLIGDLVPPEAAHPTRDGLDPHRRVEIGYPALALSLRLSLERSLRDTVDCMLRVIDDTLVVAMPDMKPAFDAVRAVRARIMA